MDITLVCRKRDKELHDWVTEYAYPIMTHQCENKTIYWEYVKALEPPEVVQVRTEEILQKSNLFSQVTLKFHTQQVPLKSWASSRSMYYLNVFTFLDSRSIWSVRAVNPWPPQRGQGRLGVRRLGKTSLKPLWQVATARQDHPWVAKCQPDTELVDPGGAWPRRPGTPRQRRSSYRSRQGWQRASRRGRWGGGVRRLREKNQVNIFTLLLLQNWLRKYNTQTYKLLLL